VARGRQNVSYQLPNELGMELALSMSLCGALALQIKAKLDGMHLKHQLR